MFPSTLLIFATIAITFAESVTRRRLTDFNKTTLYNALLDKHNEYRSITALGNTPNQPSATYMNKLVWSESLAKVAKAYSEKCVWKHNTNRVQDLYAYQAEAIFKFDSISISVGENLYAIESQESLANIVGGIEGWYNEYSTYTFRDGKSGLSSGMTGHYTQIVWADTRYVGCGYTICPTLSDTSFENAINLACNYFPTGNYGGESPYRSGDLCSACPSDRGNQCNDGLCDGSMAYNYTYCTTDLFSNCHVLQRPCGAFGSSCRGACDFCGEGDSIDEKDSNDNNSDVVKLTVNYFCCVLLFGIYVCLS
eukprot:55697_1